MATLSQTNGRLIFLDCVRGIAALAVLFEHAGDHLFPQFRAFTHDTFSFGKFGVTAFFLTSGFVIPLSFERGGSLRRFWVSRFFRLYPLYWLSIALVVALYWLETPYGAGSSFGAHLARNTLVNMTMFQEFVGIPDAQGLYYTLSMEMAFYILFSVLYVTKLNHLSLRIAWGGWVLLAVGGLAGPLVFHRRVPLAGLFYLLCLLVGTSAYRHFTGEASGKILAALLGCVACTTIAEAYCNYVLIKKDDVTERFTFWAVFLPWASAYCLFLAAYSLRGREFPRLFAWLGAVSYSVYLLHSPFTSLVPLWSNRLYTFVGILVLTLTIASLSYRFVEQPFISLGKKVYLRLSTPRREALGIEREEVARGLA
jgi:peptidoglycan/LPS O-acetylase OafA/YrhL